MESIYLPTKVTYTEGDNPNTTIVTYEPCQAGYGTTIGNAIRRVILSSMPGAAATALKIKGVDHEFSAIPKVKEDVIQIILNFKKLRLKIDTDEEVRLNLKAKGNKPVTAGDIDTMAGVEVINKDLVLCTLTDKSAEIEIEIFASRGLGYEPTETREIEKAEVGVIQIDAIYTPIRNVGYEVSKTRVGGMTNYDKLVLTVETDGSITGREVVEKSSDLLMKHFQLLNGKDIDNEALEAEAEPVVETPEA